MRSAVLALTTAASLFATPFGGLNLAAHAQGIEFGPGGVRIEREHEHEQEQEQEGRRVGKAECRELRQACLHKEELGEEGKGNCRRYREVCRR
jgi:hypothetical protein